MRQGLELDTVQGQGVDEMLLQRSEVSDCDLALKELHSFLEVTNCHV